MRFYINDAAGFGHLTLNDTASVDTSDPLGFSLCPSIGLSVAMFDGKRFLLYCPYPTVCDAGAMYPTLFSTKERKKQVTRGHNIVAAGSAVAFNPQPHPNHTPTHSHTKNTNCSILVTFFRVFNFSVTTSA